MLFTEKQLKKNHLQCEGRSPNKHNGFFIKVEPLDEELGNLIESGDLPEGRVKKKSEAITKVLYEKMGWGSDEIRNVKDIYKGNMFLWMRQEEKFI